MSYFHAKMGDVPLVFSGATWTWAENSDGKCPNGSPAHLNAAAEYPLPKPPQDPIALLAGTVTGSRAVPARLISTSTKHSRGQAINGRRWVSRSIEAVDLVARHGTCPSGRPTASPPVGPTTTEAGTPSAGQEDLQPVGLDTHERAPPSSWRSVGARPSTSELGPDVVGYQRIATVAG